MNKVFKLLIISIVLLSSIYSAFAVIDMLSFEADVLTLPYHKYYIIL